jgi:hypothetical protein
MTPAGPGRGGLTRPAPKAEPKESGMLNRRWKLSIGLALAGDKRSPVDRR